MQIGQGLLPKSLHPQLTQPEVNKDSVSPDSSLPLKLISIFSGLSSSHLQSLAGKAKSDGSLERASLQPGSVSKCQASKRPSQKMRQRVIEENT